ncbi:MAG: hypothetical protein KOO66_03895 [Bacteroidales bacterium]|nr:hypothetical protein [Bacteroidales bacterium]
MAKVEYTHEIINGKGIMTRKFYGKIDADYIIDSFVYLIDNNLIKDNCIGIISDFCNATIEMDIKDFKKVIAFIKQNKKSINLKLAAIVDTPNKSVFPFLAQSFDMPVRPFSTVEAAKKWIISVDD